MYWRTQDKRDIFLLRCTLPEVVRETDSVRCLDIKISDVFFEEMLIKFDVGELLCIETSRPSDGRIDRYKLEGSST